MFHHTTLKFPRLSLPERQKLCPIHHRIPWTDEVLRKHLLTEKVDELINDWVYVQDICKEPSASCHQYYQQCPRNWTSKAESLLWPKLLSVAPICPLSWPQSFSLHSLSFPEADPMQARLVGCFPAHQPNCSSFPAHKWYKVRSCTSQCPYFNHLSTLIDTNGFYKCKSLSSSKLHMCLRRPLKKQIPCSFSFQEMFSKYPETRGRT